MKQVLFSLVLLLLFSCGNNTSVENEVSEDTTSESQSSEQNINVSPRDVEANEAKALPENWTIQDIKGYYVGEFEAAKYHEKKDYSYSNKITISIEKVAEENLAGRSIVAGNDRPFSGTYKQTEKGIVVMVKEPGDDRYDGRFEFTVNPVENKLKGLWIANNGKLAVYEREYQLEKRAFAYNPKQALPELGWMDLYSTETSREQGADEGEFLTEDVAKVNPSFVKLKKEDIANMYKGDLEVIRNSIYARHGYSFKNRKMRYVFDRHVDWYMPVSTDVRDKLTDLEKTNIDLLKRYEQHAEVYYDSYGR